MNASRRISRHQQERVQKKLCAPDSYALFDLLTSDQMLDQVEQLLPHHRQRLFPPTEVLSMFVSQALCEDHSCQKAVNDTAVRRAQSAIRRCSTSTSAYCQARSRLPVELPRQLCRYTGQLIGQHVLSDWQWRNRPVRLVDGAVLAMPDTAANQALYPQPTSQKAGLGFPQCRLVGLICLASGALLDCATGPCRGKGHDEQSMLRTLLDTLHTGDVLLGDAFYATYFLFCCLLDKGVDCVFEQNGARRRSTDFRTGQRLGARDHIVEWTKPKAKPEWMDPFTYAQAPNTIRIRELKTGGKILVTTLLCPKSTSKTDLKSLYCKRWNIEVDFRNLKITMSMDMLSCRTPDMVIKEIWVYFLAYNLIRLLMTQAGITHSLTPRSISFKHTIQVWIAWRYTGSGCQADILFELIAQRQVGNRPGRVEPRAMKRRPKAFPWLFVPRAQAQSTIRRNGHP